MPKPRHRAAAIAVFPISYSSKEPGTKPDRLELKTKQTRSRHSDKSFTVSLWAYLIALS